MTTRKKPVEETLTMNRNGEFLINATGPTHCGVAEDLVIKYNMVCVCSTKLDTRGFLFEQLNVDKFFQSLKKTRLSCEKLTMSCVKQLMKQIKSENPACVIHRVDLTLSPEPHKAAMTYCWRSDKAPADVLAP